MAIQMNKILFLFWALASGILFYAPYAHAAIIKPANNLGLVGYWNLDEGKGTTAFNHGSATSTANGTLNSSPAWSTGKLGSALNFGGSNVSAAMSWPSSGSMSMWVNPNSYADWRSPAGWKLDPNITTDGYILIDNGGAGTPGRWRAVFRPNVGGAAETAVVALQNDTLNAWQYLTMTWSLSGTTYTIHLYVNGVDQGSATWAGTPGASGVGNFRFGDAGDYVGNAFFGKIDDVRVYNRALSAGEAAAFYNRIAGTRYNSSAQSAANGSTLNQGLVAQWTMDGADVTDKVYDRVGSNNGYFNGGATSTAKTLGKLGQAMQFNGINTYTSVFNGSPFNFTSNFTISLWGKTKQQRSGVPSFDRRV
jgi:hypothetical protein